MECISERTCMRQTDSLEWISFWLGSVIKGIVDQKKKRERRDKRRTERKKETRKERGGTGGKIKGRKVCIIYSTIMGNSFLQDTSPINTWGWRKLAGIGLIQISKESFKSSKCSLTLLLFYSKSELIMPGCCYQRPLLRHLPLTEE